ncbi:hypothetical protein H0H93_007024, partial [Arthromyces matolae]
MVTYNNRCGLPAYTATFRAFLITIGDCSRSLILGPPTSMISSPSADKRDIEAPYVQNYQSQPWLFIAKNPDYTDCDTWKQPSVGSLHFLRMSSPPNLIQPGSVDARVLSSSNMLPSTSEKSIPKPERRNRHGYAPDGSRQVLDAEYLHAFWEPNDYLHCLPKHIPIQTTNIPDTFTEVNKMAGLGRQPRSFNHTPMPNLHTQTNAKDEIPNTESIDVHLKSTPFIPSLPSLSFLGRTDSDVDTDMSFARAVRTVTPPPPLSPGCAATEERKDTIRSTAELAGLDDEWQLEEEAERILKAMQHLSRQTEVIRKQEEEVRRKASEVRLKEHELERRVQEVKEKAEQLGMKEREVTRKMEETRKMQAANQLQELKVRVREEEVRMREEKLQLREEELRQAILDQKQLMVKIYLNAIFNNTEHYKRLLLCDQVDAQTLMDSFQMLLDTGNFKNRTQMIAAMRRLAEKTESYPSRFLLDGPVPTLEDQPLAHGSYGDAKRHVARLSEFTNALSWSICPRSAAISLLLQLPRLIMKKIYAREAIVWGQLSHPNILHFYGM